MSELDAAVLAACRASLEHNSKTFAMAARLLPARSRDAAAAVYAYCRRVDDAIDEAPPERHAEALRTLHAELDAVYGEAPLDEPALLAFRAVVRRHGIPRSYPEELIRGMAMDVEDTAYETLHELLQYCHRVAAVVGLMMCHVFGIRDDRALLPAAHLGIAMQLTNICRDVLDDWQLGRRYLPRAMLREAGAADGMLDPRQPFPRDAQTLAAMRTVMKQLLSRADVYYASADLGMMALPFRAGLGVRAARLLYREIGVVIAERDFDPSRGRAVVRTGRKLGLVWRAVRLHLSAARPRRRALLLGTGELHAPRRTLEFPESARI